mgnify:CR=1 FL=1
MGTGVKGYGKGKWGLKVYEKLAIDDDCEDGVVMIWKERMRMGMD